MSIKIYVDNKEIKLEKDEFNTIGAVIKEINEMLEKENKIVNSIHVDGEVFDEHHRYNGKNCIIEVMTVSQENLFLEGLLNVNRYEKRYLDLVEELIEYDEMGLDFNDILKEIIWTVNWFLNLMISLKEEHHLDLELPEFNKIIDTMQKEHSLMKDAIEMGDIEFLTDILETDIEDMIDLISKNQDLYIRKYLEDIENRKKIN